MQNYNASHPEVPDFEDDYILAALDLGNGELGQLGLSYFDKPNGAYAVGTRQVLSATGTATELVRDCHDALATMSKVRDTYSLDLPFNLENICPHFSVPQLINVPELLTSQSG